jgi:hypothetical protein
MDSSNASSINIVVWAETRDKAAELAAIFTSGSENNEEWSGVSGNSELKAYIRYPAGFVLSSPKNNTDVLIVQISGKESSFLEEARNYINQRKAIPFKYVASSEDLSDWAKEQGAEFFLESEVSSDSNRQKIVKSVVDLEESLRKAFDGLDLNKNGFITADELVQASSSLGHQLNAEESKIIANTLSTDGNISFAKFKSWWIMGRGDFNTFRRVVQVEMKVGGLIKKSSELFNQSVAELKNQSTSGNDNYLGKINIGPVEDFESGIGFNMDIAAGKDCEEILSSLPDFFKTSPLSYGIEIKTQNEEASANLKQTLEQLNEMFAGMPQIDQVKSAGVNWNFRAVGSSLFIDIFFSGMIADQVGQSMGLFNFEQLNFSGSANASLFSGLKITDLVQGSLPDIISKICQFKVEGHSEFNGLKVLSMAISSFYKTLIQNSPYSSKFKPLVNLVKLIGAFRSLSYEFKYDSKEFFDVIKELLHDVIHGFTGMPHSSVQETFSMQLEMYQGMGSQMIDGYKPMAEPFLEPYKPTLTSINFDRLSLFVVIPKMKMYYKNNLHLTGLNAFVNEKILN